MSGIAAIFNQTGLPVDEQLIVKMASVMTDFGPKKQHYWINDNIALAHCLLPTRFESINEEQPSNVARKYWITADARIDDRDRLISKLKSHYPEVSASTTDDTLILFSYVKWGVECLNHLIGDFAFVIWDTEKQNLFCATDHFGVSPLYFSQTKNGVCLSNSINTIRIAPDTSNSLDQLAVADYLMTRTNENSNSTIFADIKHLAAGHYLLIDKDKSSLHSYWSPKPRGEIHRATKTKYVEEFGELLSLAVKDRARAAGIGTHLSGGLDSTSVTALASQTISEQEGTVKFKAYTAGAPKFCEDLESPHAIKLAGQLNIDHILIENNSSIFDYEAPSASNLLPEPVNMALESQTNQILKDVQSYGSVLLTGFGGDPLLSPEPLFRTDINTLSKLTFMSKQAWQHWCLFRKRPYIGLGGRLTDLALPSSGLTPSWVNDELALNLDLSERLNIKNLRRKALKSDQLGMQSEGLWRRIFTRNHPAFSNLPVKVCHPFFDLRLFEYSQTLPRFPWLHKKQILRESMSSVLPQSIARRPKTGMQNVTVLNSLKENGIPPHFLTLLKSPVLAEYVKTSYLENKLKHIEQCSIYDINGIMNSLGLSYWLQAYQDIPQYLIETKGRKHVKRIN